MILDAVDGAVRAIDDKSSIFVISRLVTIKALVDRAVKGYRRGAEVEGEVDCIIVS